MDKDSLQRFFEGKCTDEEARQVREYLADDTSDFTPLQELLAKPWEQFPHGHSMPEKETQETIDYLRQRLYRHPAAGQLVPMSQRRRRVLAYSLSAAAVIMLFTGVELWQYGRRPTSISGSMASPLTESTFVNKNRKVKLVELPDSSRVWLSPNSELRYSFAMGSASNRELRLTGEAYFEVKRDDIHPFVVTAGSLETKVLGTAFDIEAYPGEKAIRVSLVSGKLAVGIEAENPGTDEKQTILTAGQMLSFDKDNHAEWQDSLRLSDKAIWTKGNIVFNDVVVSDALQRLAAIFQVRIAYDKGVDLENKRVSGIFRDQSLDQMLSIILFISKYKYRISGGEVKIFAEK